MKLVNVKGPGELMDPDAGFKLKRNQLNIIFMKKVFFLLFFLPVVAASQNLPVKVLSDKFSDPGNGYRGKPFWAWNGELEKGELIRQIHVMKDMGMGGFFMHSRTGLRTEYLGDKWFELINACADEAEKLGMEAWLYDEDRWPSGLAGGLVTQYSQYRPRMLMVKGIKPSAFIPDKEYIALFSCRMDSSDCYDYKRISEKEVKNLGPDKTVLVFFTKEVESKSFNNGYTDVDRMNRKATDYFLKITHEKYKEHCGDRLGRSIKGIFIDEPNRGGIVGGNGEVLENQFSTAWTGVLAQEFKKRMGYDLMEKLPELFFRPNGNAVSLVKWQYMEVAQELFLENWLIPIHDWCTKNNIKLTGHFIYEESLSGQSLFQGSIMRAYEYEDYPGIDVLTEGNRSYWVAKQCQSVARQMGKKFMLSELYGATGWQFDFAAHKYVGDWETLFGVNMRCQHLSWYTMEGQTKRDYPASILHQSGWYSNYNYVEDFFSRMGFLMSQGQPVCDVLVINPIESIWCQIKPGWISSFNPQDPEPKEIEKRYKELFHILQGNQIDFDYGDEDIISRHGKVVIENGVPVIRINKMDYKTVVLEKMTTIRSSTLNLLNEFANAGGKIVFTCEAPSYVDVLPSNKAKELANTQLSVDFTEKAIVDALSSVIPVNTKAIDLATGKPIENIFCQLHKDGDRFILMALNTSRENKYEHVELKVKANGNVTEWDCASNQRIKVSSHFKNGYTYFESSFVEDGSHIYTITTETINDTVVVPKKTMVSEDSITGPFRYELNEPNICVLDLGIVTMEGKQPTELKEILKADQYIRDQFNLPYRSGSMVQPWFKTKFMEASRPLGKAKIAFPFYIEEIPASGIQLCLESPSEFKIILNGKDIEMNDKGWFIDKAFHLIDIPSTSLKNGENILVEEFNFRDDLDLEALYLLGDFSVRLEGNKKIIGHLPETLSVGDLTGQGFPFYSGRIRLDIPIFTKPVTGQSVAIELPEFAAACVIVDPNSAMEKMIAWKPNQVDITENLSEKDKISLEIVLTRRNTFGPLHDIPFSHTTGPKNFTSAGKNFTMDYVLYNNGLLKNPVIKLFK